ncbi:GNAT family N-acetyltransferase [Roseospira goensis]|uniref:Ribosomal protein S18 acetylase RimI-like enzyme n=1 Tax=Roseospira goensis TaxID=391922 RepID=A0A7W6S1B0_9PROT|nr:GNAT family N-acetyltransferase [Roseospira goensis]MBB4286362.1 ribosomal protein S18 acetylase RimI-like enzyme [Roseospira goensis]
MPDDRPASPAPPGATGAADRRAALGAAIAPLGLAPLTAAGMARMRAIYEAGRAEDRAAMAPLLAAGLAGGPAADPTDDPNAAWARFIDQQFTAQHRAYTDSYPGARLDFVTLAGAPIGRFYVWDGPAELRLMDLILLPAVRGRGYGRRLVTALCAQADAEARTVSLHVEHRNPIRALYDRLGFQPVADRGVYLYMERPARPAPTAGAGPVSS